MLVSKNTIKNALLPKASTLTASLNDDNITQSIDLDLFLMKEITRNIKYVYATINNSGKVVFHNCAPVRMVDNSQSSANYRNRTTWVSVSRDSAQSKEDKNIHYNSNSAIFDIFISRKLKNVNTERTNPYTCLTVSRARLHDLIVPSSITPTPEDLKTMLQPVTTLAVAIKAISESQQDDKEKAESSMKAFETYVDNLVKLVEAGLLMYTTGIITPEQSSITIGIKLEDSMSVQSHPWLNANTLLANPDIKMNQIPTTNNFRGLVEIIDSDDMEGILHSNNNAMIGRKTLSQSGDSIRYALAKIAVIKDYNSQVPITISILDMMSNGRSRVEALEALIAKGQRTLFVEGSLSPVVRTIDNEASRNGEVFFELKIERYSVHNSANTRLSVETDDYGMLDEIEQVSVGDVEQLRASEVAENTSKESEQNSTNSENDFDI